jgi:hypothetical protein
MHDTAPSHPSGCWPCRPLTCVVGAVRRLQDLADGKVDDYLHRILFDHSTLADFKAKYSDEQLETLVRTVSHSTPWRTYGCMTFGGSDDDWMTLLWG